MRVLHIVSLISRDAGGPARSVQGLVSGLCSIGVDAWLLTLKKRGLPWVEGIRNYRTANCEGANGVREAVEAVVDEIHPDIVHVHSLWQLSLHQAVVAVRKKGVPYVISPRGCLDEWSLKQGWLKKRLALLTYQGSDLRNAIAIHTTANDETRQVRKLGFRQFVLQYPNGVNFPKELPERGNQANRQMIFLSRMHKKKGVLDLVEAWNNVRPQGWRCELVYTLNGAEEESYEELVKNRVSELGLTDSFIFTGKLMDEDKWIAYRRSDCFVLPTYTENFGIVVAEALYAGLPVITTKGAPWSDLIDRNCGWWIEVGNVSALSYAINTATKSTKEVLNEMGARGHDLVVEKYHWRKIAEGVRSSYESLLSQIN